MHALLAVALLASIDLATAQRNFAELDALCARDQGRLWGRDVCGPIAFAEQGSRDAVRRNGDRVEHLRVPDTFGIANTAVDWDGTHWTMVMWPLPQNPITRRALLAHESFHRLQKELGLPMSSPANAHLDQLEARVLMRLEWRALARALASRDVRVIEDALAFRAQRRAAFPGDDERLLEMNEGLAEYTGYALAVPAVNERAPFLVKKLQNAEKGDAFARSFAYTSGPAWGTLLEMKDRRWTRHVKASDDLGELVRRAWKIRAARSGEDYGEAEVRAQEETRAAKKRELLASLRATFIDGPVVTIPLEQMAFTFDPNRVQPFEDLGSVYESVEVRDVWGKVVAPKALISPDYKKLIVPVGAFELTAAEGWNVIDGVLTNGQR
jgi:hypothetical protein